MQCCCSHRFFSNLQLLHCIANFNVTKEEEITLEGFLALHEMTGADEEGGEEEVWQVLMTLGYNNQLQLITVSSYRSQ